MTPVERVLSVYTMPEKIKEIHPLQVETINDLAGISNSGEWLDVGCGKTLCATFCALYHKLEAGHQCVVIMPPQLILQWANWLRSIRPKLTVTEYRGSPAERKKLSMDVDFLLVGIQIFKLDFDRFTTFYANRRKTVILDEANTVANFASANHQKVLDFCIGSPQILLTGTPMNKPNDAYGLLKFTSPGQYTSHKHFENLHVEERDFFGNPVTYRNLDQLSEKLKVNSKRILYEDMHKGSQEPLFDPIDYSLEPAHYKLYCKLAEEQLLKLADGGKIDATSGNKLAAALGQIVCNWHHFTGDPDKVAAGILLAEEKLEELGDQKLVVFCNYRLTVALMKARNEARAITINGDVGGLQKDRNIQRFIESDKCRLAVVQFASGGVGLDGLQHVCNHMMFLEPTQQHKDLVQCVGRLKRTGQKKRVQVWMPIATGTVQVRAQANLIKNDSIVNQVIRNAQDLREAIYGR